MKTERGDLVIYVKGNKPCIGKYLRSEQRRAWIMPLVGDKISKRVHSGVLNVAEVMINYKPLIDKQIRDRK